MLALLRSKKAQNTAEYAILIALVVGVVSAMQIYTRRGLQARLKSGIDKLPEIIADQSTNSTTVMTLFGDSTQYEPYYLANGTYNMTTTSSEGTERGTITQQGGVRELSGATTSRVGNQQITGAQNGM
jgi:hypothetical protein